MEDSSRHDSSLVQTWRPTYVFSWTYPLSSSYQPMLQTHKAGIRTGSNEYAGWGLYHYHITLNYYHGKSLPSILARVSDCLYELEEMRLTDQSFFVRIYWQILLNLTGQMANPTILEGDIFGETMDDKNLSLRIGGVNKARLELFLFYGEYEAAANIAMQWGDQYEKASGGGYLLMFETFYRCLVLYAAYRRTKERRSFDMNSVRVHKKDATWVQKGTVNLAYELTLLDAEHAAMNKKFKEAEVLFKKAIVQAARPGHWHHAALFNERNADFLLQDDSYFALATTQSSIWEKLFGITTNGEGS